MDKSFEETMEDVCGKVVSDDPKSVVAQPHLDAIQSLLGDDDCESREELQTIGF